MEPRRTRFKRAPLTLAMATTFATALTPVAFAQEGGQLEEIVVTARKQVESGQDVPVAISAFSGQTIDNLIMRDIRQLEGFIPNVVIDTVSVAPGGASLYFRGVGTQEVERSFDPAVGVVVDGVPLSFVNGSLINTFDFGTLEVLRGPQGNLFGRNTTGGVINIQRTRPTGELGVKYEATVGNEDRLDAKAVVNFPIVEGKLAGKIGAFTQQDGGLQENVFRGGDRVGDRDDTEFTGTLLWTPTDNFEALYTYVNFEDNADGVILLNRASPTELSCILSFCDNGVVDETTQDFDEGFEFELETHTLQLDYEVEYGTFTSIIGYRETDESVPTDFDAAPVPIFHTLRDQTSDQTSFELRFASDSGLSETFDFVAGVYYLEDNYELTQFTAILEVLGPAPDGSGAVFQNPTYEQDRTAWAIFGETHINIAEDWTLTLGGRYTEEEKEFGAFNQLAFGVPEGFMPIGSANADETWDEFTGKVGLDYRLNDDVMFYASFSQGFRSGGFNGRNFTPDSIGPFDPEFVDQYELGMKGDFLDRTLRWNANVFYTDYDDKQEEVIIPDGFGGTFTVVRNAATVVIQGFESEFTWVASDSLLFTANVGYLDAEYDDYVADLSGDGIATDNSDLELRRIPEFTAGLTGTYTANIGPGVLTAFAAVRYTDEYWVEVTNDPRGLLPDQTIVDATISYEWDWTTGKSIKISAFGRDLTDNMDYGSLVVVPGLFAFSSIANGTQYGVQVSGNF
ncbi:MAG: TonB-dependent receptor [Pseudomonadota bacterium]